MNSKKLQDLMFFLHYVYQYSSLDAEDNLLELYTYLQSHLKELKEKEKKVPALLKGNNDTK